VLDEPRRAVSHELLAQLVRDAEVSVDLVRLLPAADGGPPTWSLGPGLGRRTDAGPGVDEVWERVLRTGEAEALAFGATSAAGELERVTGWAFPAGDAVGFVWRVQPGVGDEPLPTATDRSHQLDADTQDLAAVVGSWEWDTTTDRVSVSSTAAALLGLRSRTRPLTLDGLLETVGESDRRRVTGTIRAAVDMAAPFTSRFDTATEPARAIRVLGRPVIIRGETRVTGIVEDVTDFVRTGEAMRRSQRLASLGLLAAGIAHDFNNVLTVMTMRADMIRSDALAGEPGDAVGDAGAILDAAARASALTRQLMLFAGQQDGAPTAVDAARLAEKMQPMVESLRGSRVQVDFDLARVPPVLADPVQLEQVLLNLALNARDALTETPPADGEPARVVIRVRSTHLTGHDDEAVALEVTDNGPGMDAETRDRACDPFFTTKGAGLGKGLGLSVVSGIAERLGGRLDISSRPGVGTTVRVVLPASSGQPGAGQPGHDGDRPRSGVVVVDADPEHLAVQARILDRAGFAVSAAADAGAALAALDADPAMVAVVYDVSGTEMDGTRFAASVLRHHPEVRVLLVTGTSPPTDVVVHPRVGQVTQPGTGWQIVAGLRQLLDVDTGAAPSDAPSSDPAG